MFKLRDIEARDELRASACFVVLMGAFFYLYFFLPKDPDPLEIVESGFLVIL